MLKSDKERVVAELTERLKTTDTLIVADYRGLTVTQIDNLRTELLKHGARFSVVKNTLTRRAAEAAGADVLLGLLEGPSAIAFLEADGDPVAVAKALADAARTTRVLAVRGGLLEGSQVSPEDVANLAKLPPADVLRAQLVGALAGPLTTVVGLFAAPLRDLVGVLQARIDQLQAQGEGTTEEAEASVEEGES
jgi:large subunit ribosomal protein L10